MFILSHLLTPPLYSVVGLVSKRPDISHSPPFTWCQFEDFSDFVWTGIRGLRMLQQLQTFGALLAKVRFEPSKTIRVAKTLSRLVRACECVLAAHLDYVRFHALLVVRDHSSSS